MQGWAGSKWGETGENAVGFNPRLLPTTQPAASWPPYPPFVLSQQQQPAKALLVWGDLETRTSWDVGTLRHKTIVA